MPADSDILGSRGEDFFAWTISRFEGDPPAPRFRPAFLGDKWPRVDFVVELVGAGQGAVPFFFVQVKATRDGYTVRDRRLRVQVEEEAVATLASYPVPTYLVGVDDIAERCYIVSTAGKRGRLASMSTAYPLEANRERLWNEVKDCFDRWRSATPPHSTFFADDSWR